MKIKIKFAVLSPFLVLACASVPAAENSIPNRLIDYPGYLKIAQQVQAPRERRRVTEEQFINMATEPATIILDARSESKFKLRHIKGALNLPFTEFTESTLAKAIPSKNIRVLIYCNNNFLGSPAAFAGKAAAASLNISTYVTLTTYGYTNIYELGPLIGIKTTKLVFEGEEVLPAK
jgi:rhodanese-related sulfurtransferase